MGNGEIQTKIDAMREKFIGVMADPVVMEIEPGSIKRFADAVGDTNPLWCDEDYAKNTENGSIVCPPGFFGWPAKQGPMLPGPMVTMMMEFAVAGFPGVLDGGVDYEFFIPIRPGDVIVASAKIADIYAKEGKTGPSVFGVLETTYTNQNGTVAAKGRMTVIGRQA